MNRDAKSPVWIIGGKIAQSVLELKKICSERGITDYSKKILSTE